MGSCVMLLQQAARAWPLLLPAASLFGVAVFLWLMVYLYLAMRRFYGQGRARTLAKLAVIGVFYAVSLGLMIVLTALVSALTL
jgi:hypothetical protein